MARRTSNKRARKLILNIITQAYGKPVARWERGTLYQLGWWQPFKQGVVVWFGPVRDIEKSWKRIQTTSKRKHEQ